jgi:nicotinamide riboside kinase
MKIGFTGTMSTGKTFLTKDLAKIPQFKDYYIATERSKYLRDLGIPLNTDSTVNGQMIFQAERSAELLHPNLITDRTIIDVMAFTLLSKSISQCNKWDLIESMSLLIKQYDFIFYVDPDGTSIENNGIRTTDPIYRQKIDEKISGLLQAYDVNYITIKGSNENRIKNILEIIA